MTGMGEFPRSLQSWGQFPPPLVHLLTEWAWRLGWRLGRVSRAFLALVFGAHTAKTGSLSWRGGLLGVLLG